MESGSTSTATENPFLRGSQIYSIFGQIEEVAANLMLKRYPEQIRRIPVEEFPDAARCPDVHRNEQGQAARFAVLMPTQRIAEFNRLIADLRA